MDARNPNFRQAVQRLFDEAEFIQRLGIELFDCGPGWCETRLAIRAGRRLIIAESDVWNSVDGPEQLVAKAIVTLAVLNKRP